MAHRVFYHVVGSPQLADLTDKFEKYRISHQRDLDVVHEKQKKGAAMYQGAVKEKNSILTQLAAKESEIGKGIDSVFTLAVLFYICHSTPTYTPPALFMLSLLKNLLLMSHKTTCKKKTLVYS